MIKTEIPEAYGTEMLAQYNEGASVPALMCQYGYTANTIRNYLLRRRSDDIRAIHRRCLEQGIDPRGPVGEYQSKQRIRAAKGSRRHRSNFPEDD